MYLIIATSKVGCNDYIYRAENEEDYREKLESLVRGNLSEPWLYCIRTYVAIENDNLFFNNYNQKEAVEFLLEEIEANKEIE